ncbi:MULTISPECIES: T6SS effector BTH_I2691 family protein [Gilliamella]|uniref:Toxin VasX N-terminal region domain-containing protein n=1 Tax=Gilliamella apicola TaxID=1196095 RepID=A0A556RUP8_9GAMM|nr:MULTISPECIES: T6SS effector BTH_I2691 family protein [Gilliamella]MBI0096506.1 hypothetical protein [Gilliamella sp. W8136]TSJ92629.1 hypothetical protein FPQ15_13970 [Gilliamella apicola]
MASIDELIKLIAAAKIKENDSGRRCPKCQEKEGDLIVLPTRLSVSGYLAKNRMIKNNLKANVEVPPLPDFAQEMVKNLPLEHSNYCIQMLRQGYLYVLVDYKNGKKEWRAFSSSPEGCLTEFENINTIPSIPPDYNCNIATDGADASYISFKNSKDIYKIHFIFSPNKITNERLEFYLTTPEFELEGMTPDQIRSGQRSIKDEALLSNILEFSTAIEIAEQEAFLHSKLPYEFKLGERDNANKQLQLTHYIYTNRATFFDKDIQKYYGRYLSLCKKLNARKGAAIVINDAIGITQSLNNRRNEALEKRMKPWMEAKDNEGISNEHRLIVKKQLDEFKKSFHDRRIKKLTQSYSKSVELQKKQNTKAMQGIYIPEGLKNQSNKILDKSEEWYNENVESIYTKELAEKEFQEKYWSRLSHEKFNKFENDFKEKSEQAEKLAKLRTKDYIKWLKSEQLITALDLYDESKKLDGIMFQFQMSMCLHGTSSSPEITDILDQWWNASQITRDNLVMRTYLFNNKSLIDDINQYLDIQRSIAIIDAPETDETDPNVNKAIELLNNLTEHINTVGSIIDQLAERGFPIAILSLTLTDLVRNFLRITVSSAEVRLHNAVGNLIISSLNRTATNMYGMGYNINRVRFSATANRGVPQLENIAQENFRNADLVNTRFAIVLLGFSAYDSYQKFKTGHIDNIREVAEFLTSTVTSIAAALQVYISTIEYSIGNKPNSKIAHVTINAFGRLFLWSASISTIAGGVMGVLDFIDGYTEGKAGNSILEISYYARGLATLALSIGQFVTVLGTLAPWLDRIVSYSTKRTIWVKIADLGLSIGRFALRSALVIGRIVFMASFIILIVSFVLIITDDNALQKWFDRCCFGKEPDRKKFADLTEELTTWNQAITETL